MGYRKSDLQFSIGCRERGQIFISKYEAYHLNLSAWQITSSEKLFLYEKYTNNFSTNSVRILDRDISRTESTIMFKFLQYLCHYQESTNKLFSVITQPWRHPGAILCFHVIIDIFISIYHKLTKFNTHKLQVISQHTDNPCRFRARHDAHVRARQNLKCSKSPINNFEHEPGHLEHFQIFRPYVSARALCARAARMNGRNSKFSHDLDSWYNNWRFPLIFSHSWPFIRPCERVKV